MFLFAVDLCFVIPPSFCVSLSSLISPCTMPFYVLAYSSPQPPPTLSFPKTSVNLPPSSPPIPPSPTSPSASYPDPTSSSRAPNLEIRVRN
ncbi:hypothetical protein RHMOL_Rhmol11G0155300 [Rhododendron molle]|uniref:Uncharacterized protein n=1 Tax=Rhododendron molle TaxID=49168 RepID=A0ACC0LU98_RHOML|nr:hypothetical protein RHMOL_Rhmol11G0155300 [Rhododendron molle]